LGDPLKRQGESLGEERSSPTKGWKRMLPATEEIRFADADQELVLCPSQPGGLRISRKACANRHRAAHRKDLKIKDLELRIALSSSLELCKGCPQGQHYSRVRRGKAASKKGNRGASERPAFE
jgi:hypothetical protein